MTSKPLMRRWGYWIGIALLLTAACFNWLLPWPTTTPTWPKVINNFALLFCAWGAGYFTGIGRGYVAGRNMYASVWDPVLRQMHKTLMGEDPGPIMNRKDPPS